MNNLCNITEQKAQRSLIKKINTKKNRKNFGQYLKNLKIILSLVEKRISEQWNFDDEIKKISFCTIQ